MIIDDEPGVINALSKFLIKEGYEVITAGDGQEGLALVRREQPDLIILDLMLPKMDGYKVCALLKLDVKYKNIPIIFCSGRANPEDEKLAKDVGGDVYILKPLSIDILTREIKRLLN